MRSTVSDSGIFLICEISNICVRIALIGRERPARSPRTFVHKLTQREPSRREGCAGIPDLGPTWPHSVTNRVNLLVCIRRAPRVPLVELRSWLWPFCNIFPENTRLMSNDIMLLDAHITLPVRRGLRPIIRLGQHQSNASHNVSVGAATPHRKWFSGGLRRQGRSADNKNARVAPTTSCLAPSITIDGD
jgi:hypothetical protein